MIRRFAALLVFACLIAAGLLAATTPKKAKRHSSKTTAAARSKSTAKSNRGATSASRTSRTSAKKSKVSAKRGKNSRTKSARSWRHSGQMTPTPDRYKEIQSALAERGYLKTTPNGVWDDKSGDALRRFQQDQNLEVTGKLNSLSLIALGLGPKRSSTVARSSEPVVAPVTPAAKPAAAQDSDSPKQALPAGPVPESAAPDQSSAPAPPQN